MGDIKTEGIFINCTSPLSECESTGWIFGGVPGICNKTTEICLCPNGYSGEDDFALFNQCHVVETTRTGIRGLVFFFALIGLFVSLYFLHEVSKKWGILVYIRKDYDDDIEETQPPSSAHQIANSTNNTNNASFTVLSSSSPVSNALQSLPKPTATENFSSKQVNNNDDSPMSIVFITNPALLSESVENLSNQKLSEVSGSSPLSSDQPKVLVESSPGTPSQSRNTLTETPKPDGKLLLAHIPSTGELLATKRQSIVKNTIKRLPRASTAALLDLAPSVEGMLKGKIHRIQSPEARRKTTERARKRWIIFLLFEFVGCNTMIIVYQSLLLTGTRTHRSGDLGIGFCLAAVFTLLFWGLWTVCYFWFRGLPNLSAYGKMFKLDSILMRHPKLVKRLFIAHLVFSSVFSYGFFLVFPSIWPQCIYHFDTVMFYFVFFYIFDFSFWFMLICLLLLRVFDLLNQNMVAKKLGTGQQPDNSASNGKNTVRAAIVVVCIAAPIALIVAGALIWAPQSRVNLWMLSQAISAMFLLTCNVILYIIVYRAAGGSSSNTSNDNT